MSRSRAGTLVWAPRLIFLVVNSANQRSTRLSQEPVGGREVEVEPGVRTFDGATGTAANVTVRDPSGECLTSPTSGRLRTRMASRRNRPVPHLHIHVNGRVGIRFSRDLPERTTGGGGPPAAHPCSRRPGRAG